MDKKGLAQKAVEALKQEYPDALCSLEYTDPLQLLIATPWRPSARTPGSTR